VEWREMVVRGHELLFSVWNFFLILGDLQGNRLQPLRDHWCPWDEDSPQEVRWVASLRLWVQILVLSKKTKKTVRWGHVL
jgi:hypothetical protein